MVSLEQNIIGVTGFSIQPPERTFVCRAAIFAAEEGGFVAYARRLPGVVSQGESIDEAEANIAEAYAGAIESYMEHKMAIPFSDSSWYADFVQGNPVAVRDLVVTLNG